MSEARPCARCEGSGVYRWLSRRGRRCEGVCFRCEGSGIDPRRRMTPTERREIRSAYVAWRQRQTDDESEHEMIICEICETRPASAQRCPGDGGDHGHGRVHRKGGGLSAVCGVCIEVVRAEWNATPGAQRRRIESLVDAAHDAIGDAVHALESRAVEIPNRDAAHRLLERADELVQQAIVKLAQRAS